MVGREADVVALERALSVNALVTLVAVGGAGKTRLALEVARRATERTSFSKCRPSRRSRSSRSNGDNGFSGSAMSLFMNLTTSFAPSTRYASKYHHS